MSATRYFTLDDMDGTRLEAVGPITREQFIALSFTVADEIANDNDGRTTTFEVHEWRSREEMDAWMNASTPPPGETWSSLHRAAHSGDIRWCFPGIWTFLAPGEQEPRPSGAWMAANAPLSVVEDEMRDAYEVSDPKHPDFLGAA